VHPGLGGERFLAKRNTQSSSSQIGCEAGQGLSEIGVSVRKQTAIV
jgi:hypothetical protein